MTTATHAGAVSRLERQAADLLARLVNASGASLETARAYARLCDRHGMTVERLAERLGRTPDEVRETLLMQVED